MSERYSKDMTPAADLLPLPAGLVAVTGDEGSGKTSLLRGLCELLPALWLDLSLPAQDQQTPGQAWDALRHRCPRWNMQLQEELVQALGLGQHLDKSLFMLSTGS